MPIKVFGCNAKLLKGRVANRISPSLPCLPYLNRRVFREHDKPPLRVFRGGHHVLDASNQKSASVWLGTFGDAAVCVAHANDIRELTGVRAIQGPRAGPADAKNVFL